MKRLIETHNCDKCGGDLPTSKNSLDIVTSVTEGSGAWARLHVKIMLHHGINNSSRTEDADLCQRCAIELLKDALQRVRMGERSTAGTENSLQGNWVVEE